MRIPGLLTVLLLVFQILIDSYLYIIAKKRCKTRLLPVTQLITSAFLLLVLIAILAWPKKGNFPNSGLVYLMWMLFAYLTIYIPKCIFVIIDLLARLPRLWHHKRSRTVSYAGGIAAIGLCALMWWGALINRYNLNVTEVTIAVPDLPDSFDQFRIVQISDLHTGTYDSDTTFVSKLVERINSLNADAVLFTGDIVNRRTSELCPFVNTLSQLQSANGTYSILGNHDYGDYCNWPSTQAKADNMELMYQLQKSMNWNLLLNETAWIHRGNDSIAIIGVENWGDPPFPRYGNLTKAYPTLSDNNVKILLTHNPYHWEEEIACNDTANVALTLSGHTHAMQMSAGHISPAAMRYKEWG
ncbi:MAG: metallophosphoesterase, partial [Muribaculaceae bacterium]|nr:metallophosphoesterase [Muribaculaceae bacterium]